MAEQDAASWEPIGEAIELPSPCVRFHKVIEDGEVVDTLAIMANGQSVSLNVLLGLSAFNA